MKFNFKFNSIQFNSIQFNSILLVLLISFLVSCKEEQILVEPENSVFTKEALSINENFVRYIDIQLNVKTQLDKKMQELTESDRQKVVKQLQEIGNNNNPTEKDAHKLGAILGFTNYEDYLSFRKDLGKTVESLTKSYPQLENMTSETQKIVAEAISLALNDNKSYKQQASCAQKLSNCSDKANITFLGIQAGCIASIFSPLPILAAPCAAIGYANYLVDAEKCNLDYSDCAG